MTQLSLFVLLHRNRSVVEGYVIGIFYGHGVEHLLISKLGATVLTPIRKLRAVGYGEAAIREAYIPHVAILLTDYKRKLGPA